MNPPNTLKFDIEKGLELAEEGMARAAEVRPLVLSIAKRIAIDVAMLAGEVTADDVQCELIRLGFTPDQLGNASGSIFRDGRFRWTGRVQKSDRVSRRGGLNRIWALVD